MSGSQSTGEQLVDELLEFFHSEFLSEDELREILERFGCAPNNNLNIDNYGFFIMACHNDLVTEEIIRYLLEYFPDAAGYTSAEGLLTPLHSILFANKNVTRGIVQLIIDACPESIDRANSEGNTPLHHLCHKNKIEDSAAMDILGLLLERCPEAAQHVDGSGALPIHIAIVKSKSLEFCRMLIEAYPGSENVADGKGMYPIHHAIKGDPAIAFEMVQMLLDCDPNVASQTLHECSPLFLVCALGSPDVGVLVNDNASMTISILLKILFLLYDAHPEAIEDNMIEFLFDKFPEQIQDFITTQLAYARPSRDPTFMSTRVGNGQLPLHLALRDDVTLGSIKLLVKGNPVAVQTPDDSGALPLHVACQHNDSPKVVDFLVGLDPNTLTAVDRGGNTALHVACHGAKYDTIALLLEKYDAVSVSTTNGHNMLPIHLLLESDAIDSREDDSKYTESIFRLLRAYPDTVMM